MLRSFTSQWLGLAIVGVISVVLTPILVHGLGAFYYGLWILASSVLDYYGLLDLGIRYTLQRFVSRYHGANDQAGVNETLATALAGATGIGVLLCVLSLALATVLAGFFNLSGPSGALLRQLIIIEGLSAAVVFPARLLGAYLCGLDRFDLYNLAAVTTATLRAVLFVVVLRGGLGVRGIVEVELGVALLTLVLNWRLVRWADRLVSCHWRLVRWARLRELAHFSVYVFLSSLGDQLRFYTDAIVIARFLSVALTTPFNVVSRLIEYYKLTFYPVTGPLTTTMSSLEGQRRESDLQRMFLGITKMTALLALLGGSLLLLHGKAVLRLWVGKTFEPAYGLLAILVAGYIITLGQLPSQTILYAKARHRALALWTLGEGVANLALSIYWAGHQAFPEWVLGRGFPDGYYGLVGVALGTAVPMLVVRLSIQPWYVLRTIRLPAVNYLRDALFRPALAGVTFVAIGRVAESSWMGSSLAHLALTVAWQTALFGVLAYTLALDGPERRLFRERLGRALGWEPARGEQVPIGDEGGGAKAIFMESRDALEVTGQDLRVRD